MSEQYERDRVDAVMTIYDHAVEPGGKARVQKTYKTYSTDFLDLTSGRIPDDLIANDGNERGE